MCVCIYIYGINPAQTSDSIDVLMHSRPDLKLRFDMGCL